jgi:hypothetical protein
MNPKYRIPSAHYNRTFFDAGCPALSPDFGEGWIWAKSMPPEIPG